MPGLVIEWQKEGSDGSEIAAAGMWVVPSIRTWSRGALQLGLIREDVVCQRYEGILETGGPTSAPCEIEITSTAVSFRSTVHSKADRLGVSDTSIHIPSPS